MTDIVRREDRAGGLLLLVSIFVLATLSMGAFYYSAHRYQGRSRRQFLRLLESSDNNHKVIASVLRNRNNVHVGCTFTLCLF